jgi:hypothetical protein
MDFFFTTKLSACTSIFLLAADVIFMYTNSLIERAREKERTRKRRGGGKEE